MANLCVCCCCFCGDKDEDEDDATSSSSPATNTPPARYTGERTFPLERVDASAAADDDDAMPRDSASTCANGIQVSIKSHNCCSVEERGSHANGRASDGDAASSSTSCKKLLISLKACTCSAGAERSFATIALATLKR